MGCIRRFTKFRFPVILDSYANKRKLLEKPIFLKVFGGGIFNRNTRQRVWKGILGIRDLTKIRYGNRENDKYLNGIRMNEDARPCTGNKSEITPVERSY